MLSILGFLFMSSFAHVKLCKPLLADHCIMFCHVQMQRQVGRPRQLLRRSRRRQLTLSRKQQGSRMLPLRQQTACRRRRRPRQLLPTSSRVLQFRQRQLQVEVVWELMRRGTCKAAGISLSRFRSFGNQCSVMAVIVWRSSGHCITSQA